MLLFNNHSNSPHFWNLRIAVVQTKMISVTTVQTEEVHKGVKHCRCWDVALGKEDKLPDRGDRAQG